MRMFRAVVASTLLMSMVAAGSAAAPASAERATYIVVLDDSVTDVEATARSLAHGVGGELGFVYEYALKGFSATLSAQAASALARNPRVAFVSPNGTVHMTEQTTPTGVSRIDAPVSAQTGTGIRVAIIDTGIDLDHPDLAGNIDQSRGVDCISPGTSADDDQGHGTHVAGTVAAISNSEGVVGVAPGATLVPVKVLNSQGSGTWDQVICGINHVANPDLGIHVANMSLGGTGTASGSCADPGDDAMYAAICGALANGVILVVAAGNDGRDASGFVPAAYPEVVTVSAYTDLDGSPANSGCTGGRGPFRTCDETFASFSNYGSVVDVIAPGVTINSTTIGGSYGTKSGTSMAAPHVAGVAALILAANPGMSPADVAAHLRATGQCPDGNINSGSGPCSGQGTWANDRDSLTEPMANAAFALGTTPDEPTNQPPTASFTYSCTDRVCSFNASGSSDPGGSISSYAWNFGDETTASGVTTSHTYAAGGTYSVILTVTDDGGLTDSDSQEVTVTEPGDGDGATYNVALTESTSSSGPSWTANVTITVNAGENPKVEYQWDGGSVQTCTATCTVSITLHKRVSSTTLTVVEVNDGTDFDGETQVTVFKP